MVSIQSTLRCHYRYDPLDRLINQTQPDTPVHQRFYCKSRLATEIQGAIQHSIIQHGDLLLAQGRRQEDLIETTLLATDLQRSVLQTLKANQQGQPIAYSPYGHRRAESGLTSLLGFNGERPDPVTGHYLLGNGYRAFNPVLMRFNSPDSWSPFGKGGLNAYAYCKWNPISESDPTGHANMVKVVSAVKIGLKSSLNRARARLAVPSGKHGDMVHQPYQLKKPGVLDSYSSSSRVVNRGTSTEFTYPSGLTRAVMNRPEPSLYQSSINALPGKYIQHALNTPGELPATLQNKLLPLDATHAQINYYNHIGRSNITALNSTKNPFKLKAELIAQALNGEAPGVTPETAKSILFQSGQYDPSMSSAAQKFHRDLYEDLFNIRNHNDNSLGQ
ncbi:RHS repeat-associated core domain-containing protein [Pseudomonas sp. RIT-PI-q]|uniref:RHS repeat-associated core domain-containing protein n=1 Tax=Pseudomonas sp. RIT-PI-q TaxID=1690247 RepID=UPI0009EAFFA4|nr:RHS repeat-associated core domain-containing protein [Pseudomonas sp. RIT-PI-q]